MAITSVFYRKTLLATFSLIALSYCAAAFAIPKQVENTSRLNLRTCPDTQRCPVIRTLALSTHLAVLEQQGDWYSVRVIEDGSRGWVHRDYVRELAQDKTKGTVSFDALSEYIESIRIWLLVAGAILILSILGSRIHPTLHSGRLLALLGGSLIVGSSLLLNQFGPALSLLSWPLVDLGSLEGWWRVNEHIPGTFSYNQVLGLVLLLSLITAMLVPSAGGKRQSYFQGWLTGTLLLPSLGALLIIGWLAIRIVGFVLILLSWIFTTILLPVLQFVCIPFVWLWEKIFGPLFSWIWTYVLSPLLHWIAVPFVWIWENLLKDIFLTLAAWLDWLWSSILQPFFNALMGYFVVPLVLAILGCSLVAVALSPLIIVGAAILDSVRTSVSKPLDSLNLFSHGFNLGLLFFDSLSLLALTHFSLVSPNPPLSLLIFLVIPIPAIYRLIGIRSGMTESIDLPQLIYKQKALWYVKNSPAAILSACLVIPLFYAIQFMGLGED